MTAAPERRRRRLAQDEPQTDPSIKRLYWYGGAALGVIAGVLVSLFVVPPIFDHYFGIADIGLGHTYSGDHVKLRIADAGMAADDPERFAIVMEVSENTTWCPEATAFRLEVEGNVTIGGGRLEPDPADCGGDALADGPLTITFPANRRTPEQLRILHVDDPKVRLYLQPGEPGE